MDIVTIIRLIIFLTFLLLIVGVIVVLVLIPRIVRKNRELEARVEAIERKTDIAQENSHDVG